MKLSIISASIIAYTVLAAIWVCDAKLMTLVRVGAPF